MSSTKAIVGIFIATLALSACGKPDHPKPHHGGAHPPPGYGAPMPPASPSIHLSAQSSDGRSLNLSVECGADTALKACAQVSESILQKASGMRSPAPK